MTTPVNNIMEFPVKATLRSGRYKVEKPIHFNLANKETTKQSLIDAGIHGSDRVSTLTLTFHPEVNTLQAILATCYTAGVMGSWPTLRIPKNHHTGDETKYIKVRPQNSPITRTVISSLNRTENTPQHHNTMTVSTKTDLGVEGEDKQEQYMRLFTARHANNLTFTIPLGGYTAENLEAGQPVGNNDDVLGNMETFYDIVQIRRKEGGRARLPYLNYAGIPVNLQTFYDEGVNNRHLDGDQKIHNLLTSTATHEPRLEFIKVAASVPITEVITALGGEEVKRYNKETGEELTSSWMCPSTHKHSALIQHEPKMRVYEEMNLCQCFVCDKEKKDGIQLTMSRELLGPDDAALWILTNTDTGQKLLEELMEE